MLAGGSGTAGFGTGGVRGGAVQVCEVLTSTDGGSESPDVSVALTDAGRSCMGVRGRIIADAFCGSGALGFASAAIAGMVSAGAAGGS